MARQSRTATAFEQALQLIHTRACTGLTIEQILDSVPISRTTLERQFLENIGRTPGQELIRVRIAQAQHLLATTNLPIKRIAQMAGFRQATNFSVFFRKQTNLSPTAFRRSKTTTKDFRTPFSPNVQMDSSQMRIFKLNMHQNVASAMVF